MPLGTMFCNGVGYISDVLVVQDVVQNPEILSRKAFHRERSFMPDKSDITNPYCRKTQIDRECQVTCRWLGGRWFLVWINDYSSRSNEEILCQLLNKIKLGSQWRHYLLCWRHGSWINHLDTGSLWLHILGVKEGCHIFCSHVDPQNHQTNYACPTLKMTLEI